MTKLPGNIKARLRGVQLGSGSKFSWGAKVFKSKNSKIVFGKNCKILNGAIIAPHPHGSVVFGDNCSINPYCMIYGHGGLEVGSNVRIAAHTTIIPANHRYIYQEGQMSHTDLARSGIVIGDNVWIGSGVRILDGVVIAANTIIGAGSVVTRSIEVPGVYGGVPAKFIRPHGP
ncbi:acyltransferase [Aquicoccus porphyridii]|uniref:Acyltransferase n=2 Tax=Aquicoccus porphyridii TaxID=1852029 RepID=A0A5A9YYP9_9RHOB|nr:acyltransferase [Aquicoccus porphyridii]RAI52083.1 acyltransferase [Rhodobacteraceae bacterium AsT-22]